MLVNLRYHKEIYGEMPLIDEIIINTRYIKRIDVSPDGHFAILYDDTCTDWWIRCVDKWKDVKDKFEVK